MDHDFNRDAIGKRNRNQEIGKFRLRDYCNLHLRDVQLLVSICQRIIMSSLRWLELGLGCLFGAILNFIFGYWINIVLVMVGMLCVVISFIEGRVKAEAITKT